MSNDENQGANAADRKYLADVEVLKPYYDQLMVMMEHSKSMTIYNDTDMPSAIAMSVDTVRSVDNPARLASIYIHSQQDGFNMILRLAVENGAVTLRGKAQKISSGENWAYQAPRVMTLRDLEELKVTLGAHSLRHQAEKLETDGRRYARIACGALGILFAALALSECATHQAVPEPQSVTQPQPQAPAAH